MTDNRVFHEKRQLGKGDWGPARGDYSGATVVSGSGSSRFGEAAVKGHLFHALSPSLTLDGTSGNLLNSSAANAVTATNTALVNVSGSGVAMLIQRVALTITSGTLAPGGVAHSIGTGHTVAASLSGMAKGYSASPSGARAAGYFFTKATGTTYTGASAPVAVQAFATSTATAAAQGYLSQVIDEIDGGFCLLPGDEYRPQFYTAGTTIIYSVGYTWTEVPVATV
jgi:hypothetical protein